MLNIERDQKRIDANGEVFTPSELVNEILDQLPKDLWSSDSKTFLDPACGDGNFLVAVKERLMKKNDEKNALSRIYGVDLMPDNVQRCIQRLYGDAELTEIEPFTNTHNTYVVRRWSHPKYGVINNIVCADGLKYDYSFKFTSLLAW